MSRLLERYPECLDPRRLSYEYDFINKLRMFTTCNTYADSKEILKLLSPSFQAPMFNNEEISTVRAVASGKWEKIALRSICKLEEEIECLEFRRNFVGQELVLCEPS